MGEIDNEIMTKLLRENKPEKCEKCDGFYQYRGGGKYICDRCGDVVYDDFGKIKKYLDENGPSPAIVISRETGVSRAVISAYLENGRIMKVEDGML